MLLVPEFCSLKIGIQQLFMKASPNLREAGKGTQMIFYVAGGQKLHNDQRIVKAKYHQKHVHAHVFLQEFVAMYKITSHTVQ